MPIPLLISFNYTCWGIVGALRFFTEKFQAYSEWNSIYRAKPRHQIKPHEVAVIVPAKNEALVIGETINLLKKTLPGKNIHVVSDGSTDGTEVIAKELGVKVFVLSPSNGKAGALFSGIQHFKLDQKYKAVLFVDADSLISPDYLEKALPLFDDPRTVVVAGHASTLWQPEKSSLTNMLFVAHRERLYFLTQALLKYGQTWGKINVCPIAPGFASLYRSEILSKINIKAPGLIIEDFNMTFEVHRQGLGKIAYYPGIGGNTQDPGTFRSYFRQINRWNLGFWQTVRRQGIWPSFFWAALSIYLLEVLVSSVILLLLPVLILILPDLTLELLFYAVFLPDYLLTTITAMVQGRVHYYLLGFLFPFLRIIDAYSFLYNLPKAFFTTSTGVWISPERREMATSKAFAELPNSGGGAYEARKN